jgi:aryl-alcohol dehydrogenase-like predicted oxidoreductase
MQVATSMSDFTERVPLGRTGLVVSRLGLGASYGAPTRSYEEAFERGVNYFYWGALRRGLMGKALRRIAKTRRDELVIVVQSYVRAGFLVKASVKRALCSLGIDHADILLLGWYNRAPADRIVDAGLELRDKGLVGHLAVSGHERKMFPALVDDTRYGAWHLRYNAVHRGAEREVFPALEGRGVEERPGVVTFTSTRWGQLCDPSRTPPGERTPSGTDCYRFAMSDPHVDVAIAGPGDGEQMRQALAALEAGPLSDEEQRWMRRVGDHIYGRDSSSGLRDAV